LRHDKRDLWARVHQERAALADDLRELDDRQWLAPSLCQGLSVREVLAHLTAGATLTGPQWLAGVIRCRFDFDRQVAMQLANQLGADADETLARFDAAVTSTTKPPLPAIVLLGEAIVHGEDIRRALGLRRRHPLDTLAKVADHYAGSDLTVLARGRIRGLSLVATDSPWRTGGGPQVSGPILALIMVMTGRTAFLADVTGPGVEHLRRRS